MPNYFGQHGANGADGAVGKDGQTGTAGESFFLTRSGVLAAEAQDITSFWVVGGAGGAGGDGGYALPPATGGNGADGRDAGTASLILDGCTLSGVGQLSVRMEGGSAGGSGQGGSCVSPSSGGGSGGHGGDAGRGGDAIGRVLNSDLTGAYRVHVLAQTAGPTSGGSGGWAASSPNPGSGGAGGRGSDTGHATAELSGNLFAEFGSDLLIVVSATSQNGGDGGPAGRVYRDGTGYLPVGQGGDGGDAGDSTATMSRNQIVGSDGGERVRIHMDVAAGERGNGGGSDNPDGSGQAGQAGTSRLEFSDNVVAMGDGDDRLDLRLNLRDADEWDLTGNTLDGGAGHDVLTFEWVPVEFDFLENTVIGFEEIHADHAILLATSDAAERITIGSGIVHARGGDDDVTGRGELHGGDGDDVLESLSIGDQLLGGAGFDTARYSAADTAVAINLTSGVHGGSAEGDAFSSIEAFLLSAHNDTFVGSAADETMDGGFGDDVINGGLGNDFIVGGNGTDVAVFSGLAGNYLIVAEGDGYRVKGADGSDFVSEVELLRFDDLTIDLLKIVCDPVSGRVLVGEDAPLVLPEDERAPSKSGDADPLGPPVSLDPLVLPTGLDPKASDDVRPEICPADEAGHFSGVSRPLLDLDALGLSTFDGRDPHRLMLQPAAYDWIV